MDYASFAFTVQQEHIMQAFVIASVFTASTRTPANGAFYMMVVIFGVFDVQQFHFATLLYILTTIAVLGINFARQATDG
ncbi:MAG: hypothetical protein AAFV93_01925 [Chloroflexota bacterium]